VKVLDSRCFAGGPLRATVTGLQVQSFPYGAPGIIFVDQGTLPYSCGVPAPSSTSQASSGCAFDIAPKLLPDPLVDEVEIQIAVADAQEAITLSVFRPKLSLTSSTRQLRRLSDPSCLIPVYQSATLTALATFLHPDKPGQQLILDVSGTTALSSSNSTALEVNGSRIIGHLPVANVTVFIDAAVGVNPEETSLQLDVLDTQTCVDALQPVVVSVASANVLESTPSEITVRLSVSQVFEEPGDTGIVAVYALSEGDAGAVISDDVTRLVRESSALRSLRLSSAGRMKALSLFLHSLSFAETLLLPALTVELLATGA
jgi:hypothetical protein